MKKHSCLSFVTHSVLIVVITFATSSVRLATAADQAPYLRDRGDGMPLSLLGTYIREKELIVYPFFEYTKTRKFEYKPSDLRATGSAEFFGRKFEREALLHLGYAFTDTLAIEFESALHGSVDFRKAPNDTSNLPSRIRESGLGDTEAQLRWRVQKESATRPDLTLFFKSVFPLQRSKLLLGAQDWELAGGAVLTKGFSFGTLSLRAALDYDTKEHKFKIGEYGVDYLKRISDRWRVALSLEVHQVDEVQAIGEIQYQFSKNAMLKINSGFGLTKKAPSFAPEIGVLFSF
jgi:hypothetical protein